MMSSAHFTRELVNQRIADLVTEARGRTPLSRAQAPLAERASRTPAMAAALRRLADRLDPPVAERHESMPALASGSRNFPC
jgi:hypothetical protein